MDGFRVQSQGGYGWVKRERHRGRVSGWRMRMRHLYTVCALLDSYCMPRVAYHYGFSVIITAN